MDKTPIALAVNAQLETLVPTERREDYLAALRREVDACAGLFAQTTTVRLSFTDCSAANMTLAFWCGLMDSIREAFPGAPKARLLFDIEPRLANPKTVQYAMKYRTLFNLRIPGFLADEDAWAASDEARDLQDVMASFARERCGMWGIQASAASLAGTCDARRVEEIVARIGALGPCYLRTEAPLPAELSAALAEAGYAERTAGDAIMYAHKPIYASWFGLPEEAGCVAFGAGSTSRIGESERTTTSDVEAYIAHAGDFACADAYTGELAIPQPALPLPADVGIPLVTASPEEAGGPVRLHPDEALLCQVENGRVLLVGLDERPVGMLPAAADEAVRGLLAAGKIVMAQAKSESEVVAYLMPDDFLA